MVETLTNESSSTWSHPPPSQSDIIDGVDLSKQALATVRKSFSAEAASAFQFLTDEFGLAGPELQGVVLPVIGFVGRGIRYRIMLNSDEHTVMTRVEINLDAMRLVAELENLVQAAGIGARNDVAQRVSTLSSLRHSLDSQATYVRLLHPRMLADNVVELMRTANAREWNVR